MSEVRIGLRGLLGVPLIYRIFKLFIASRDSYHEIVNTYIRPQKGDKVLDIGCGPADILDFLCDVEYMGFDANPRYIQEARKRYSSRGSFSCQIIDEANWPTKYEGYFDIVIALGILHHLDDSEALKLLKLAHKALKPEGRLITLYGVFIEKQNRLARWVISMDRGQNVRSEAGYVYLVKQVFQDFDVFIRHDMLRIPYTHIIIECVKR